MNAILIFPIGVLTGALAYETYYNAKEGLPFAFDAFKTACAAFTWGVLFSIIT